MQATPEGGKLVYAGAIYRREFCHFPACWIPYLKIGWVLLSMTFIIAYKDLLIL